MPFPIAPWALLWVIALTLGACQTDPFIPQGALNLHRTHEKFNPLAWPWPNISPERLPFLNKDGLGYSYAKPGWYQIGEGLSGLGRSHDLLIQDAQITHQLVPLVHQEGSGEWQGSDQASDMSQLFPPQVSGRLPCLDLNEALQQMPPARAEPLKVLAGQEREVFVTGVPAPCLGFQLLPVRWEAKAGQLELALFWLNSRPWVPSGCSPEATWIVFAWSMPKGTPKPTLQLVKPIRVD